MKTQLIACLIASLVVISIGCTPDRTPEYIRSFNVVHDHLNRTMDILRLKAQSYAQLWAEEIERRGKDDVEWKTVDATVAEDIREVVSLHEVALRELAAPPQAMQKAHDKLVTQYRLLTDMAKLAESPQGFVSLRDYWDRIKAVQSQYEALNSEISVLVPAR